MSALLPLPDAAAIQGAIRTLAGWHAGLPPARSGRGLEALIAGAVLGAPRRAWLLPGPREIGCALLRGATPDRLQAARPWRVVPPGDDPAQRALQAVGMAMAGDPAVVFLGTGSMAYGAAQEAISLAALHRAPVCFVVGWYDPEPEAPFAAQLPVGPATLALALGLESVEVDGQDGAAVARAVSGPGPRLVEARLRGRG